MLFWGHFRGQKSCFFGGIFEPKISAKNQAKIAQKCAKWPKQRANALALTV
jgi:hypothetical protein